MKLFLSLLLCIPLFSISQGNCNNYQIIQQNSTICSGETVELSVSSIENNPHYDVYYIQQKFNGIVVHNAISSMAIKNGEVKSYNNRFVNRIFGKGALVMPKIDRYF